MRNPESHLHDHNGRSAADLTVRFQPEHFLNRELSWLDFNARVLEEAFDPQTPLLERLKFLCIFSSNLDEFFMVRVAGLREQAFQEEVPQDRNPDGMKAIEQLLRISIRTRELVAAQYACLLQEVLPALQEEGIEIVDYASIRREPAIESYFQEMLFPVITPMAIDPSHPHPRYHNRSLYLIAKLRRRGGLGPRSLFAVVQVPNVLPRLMPIPDRGNRRYVLLEDVLASRLTDFFGGFQVEEHASFRITRDSDIEIIEQESDDMLRLIEDRLKERRRADAVRLEITAGSDPAFTELIVKQEELRHASSTQTAYSEVYPIHGPLDITSFSAWLGLPNCDHLRDPPITPLVPRGLRRPGEMLFDAIRRRDILLHHPYDSFTPVVDFVRRAAQDPAVLAIKQTLYRTSGDSPIVGALSEAAENGKHVTAIVELKARFDEAANVSWARQMERAGVHVVYGLMDLKTHCKMSLIVRREDASVRRYVHLSTGNYNPSTAVVYTDLGLFTCDDDIATDVTALFNLLTGYSQGHRWRKLIVAPSDLQRGTLELIEEQTQLARKGLPARIIAKINSLVDPRVIEALYLASQAGVEIELIVRGICCLRPGVPGISDNIRVWSIVDRFLEHSRILVFGPDESAKVYLTSADWMPRNFYRRVEVMFPIESSGLRKRILQEILPAYRRDNVKARDLRSDGTYVRRVPKPDQTPHRCQMELMELNIQNALQQKGFSGPKKKKFKLRGENRSKHKQPFSP